MERYRGRFLSDPSFLAEIGSSIQSVPGQKVAVALRPEKVRIGRSLEGDTPNRVGGAIDEIAYMGNLSVYHVRLNSGKRVRVTQSNLTRSDESALTWDDKVEIGWDAHAGVVVAP